jgi:hypothetical protein
MIAGDWAASAARKSRRSGRPAARRSQSAMGSGRASSSRLVATIRARISGIVSSKGVSLSYRTAPTAPCALPRDQSRDFELFFLFALSHLQTTRAAAPFPRASFAIGKEPARRPRCRSHGAAFRSKFSRHDRVGKRGATFSGCQLWLVSPPRVETRSAPCSPGSTGCNHERKVLREEFELKPCGRLATPPLHTAADAV